MIPFFFFPIKKYNRFLRVYSPSADYTDLKGRRAMIRARLIARVRSLW